MAEVRSLRMGTRGSLLARSQSGTFAAEFAAASGHAVVPVIVRTEGDDTSVPLHAPSRPGVFVATLRDRLLAGDVDLVVHSFKDLPSAAVPGLVVAAVPERVDARDAVVVRDGLALHDLPAGARVGTSSPRRAAALRRQHPDLAIVAIRGNVDTRLARVAAGEVDAVVLALAGLIRLGRVGVITEVLDPEFMIPAPAQGALAVECRVADEEVVRLLGLVDDAAARLTVAAERAVLAGVDAACTTAVGAYALLRNTGNVPGSRYRLELVAEITDHAGVAYRRVVDSAGLAGASGIASAEGASGASGPAVAEGASGASGPAVAEGAAGADDSAGAADTAGVSDGASHAGSPDPRGGAPELPGASAAGAAALGARVAAALLRR